MSDLVLTVEGKDYAIDEDGFIQDPAVWDEAVALGLAKTEGVEELTEDHWKVVNYLREYYIANNILFNNLQLSNDLPSILQHLLFLPNQVLHLHSTLLDLE